MVANSFETLKKVIEDNSEADHFFRAVHEWGVVAVEEDPLQEGECAGERIFLEADFSRDILRWLYEAGAFPANRFNNNNGENDYLFLLDMFNKHIKDNITQPQQRKIWGLLNYTVKPFVSNHPALG